MDFIKQNFGICLKKIRKMKNYTQEMLAEAIGINLRQLARIEAGESFVSSETLYKICEKLEVEPWELFNFNLNEQYLMTGTGNVVYLDVIKSGNISQIVSKKKHFSETKTNENQENFNDKMSKMAKSIKKEIVVDEIENGEIVCTKIYKPNGDIEFKSKNHDNTLLQELKEKIHSITTDKKKLSFMNLAYEAMFDKEALKELKALIKGIELMQD